MNRTITVFFAAMALLACAADKKDGTGAPGCADISGSYTVTSTRASGTCDPSLDPKGANTVTFTKTDGAWNVVVPGLEGGCPGELNPSTCRYIAICKAYSKTTGETIMTYNIDYTFAGTTLKGSSAGALVPPAVQAACTVTYSETGTKL